MSTTTEENDDDEITIEPSRAFTEALVEQVNREDVHSMVDLQKDMYCRLYTSPSPETSLQLLCRLLLEKKLRHI